MAIPSTREEFKAHCLRALGYPVIDITGMTDVDRNLRGTLKCRRTG